MTPVIIYYSIQNGGDGSAYPTFFLTEEAATNDQDLMYEGWSEDCSGTIETFVGSSTHLEAIENEAAKRTLWSNGKTEEGDNYEEDELIVCPCCADEFEPWQMTDSGLCEFCDNQEKERKGEPD